MNQSWIGWIALTIAVFVYLDLLFVELRRIFREGKRIVTRVLAWADLPVIAQAAHVGDDLDRITTALERVSPLMLRGERALARLRRPRAAAAGYEPLLPNGSDASNGFSAD